MSFPILAVVSRERFYEAKPLLPPDLDLWHWDDWSSTERAKPRGFRGVLGVGAPLPAAVLRAPELEILQLVSAGYEKVDMAAVERGGFTLCNNPGMNAAAVAEHILMSFLYFARRMGECQRALYEGDYQDNRARLMGPLLRDLREMTVGLVGFGSIGRRVAERVRPFGAPILYYNRTRRPEDEARYGLRYRELDDLLREADAIAVMLPLNERTRGLFDARRFALMKSSAIFVNVGRGAVVDQQALTEALVQERLYAASIDVYDPEPVTPDNPLVRVPQSVRDRLLLSPHIAGVTHRTWHDMVQRALDNLASYARGEEPHHVIVRGHKLRAAAPL